MKTILAMAVLGGFAVAAGGAYPQDGQASEPATTQAADNTLGTMPALPAPPAGKSTILGGQIRDVDPVRDQFSLHSYGERPLTILFDERTQLFHDGVKVPLRELGPEDRASVQTVLDGANVFAISIHVLSHSPEGECHGRVISFDPRTNLLVLASAISPEPIILEVPRATPVAREGEREFVSAGTGLSDLVPGALVTATFAPDSHEHDVARRVTVLAVPGASFVFSGNIAYLDLRAGSLTIVDPRDGKSYDLRMSPAAQQANQDLHRGQGVTVTASFDGSSYTATAIVANN